jgi:hypothetical protein
MPKGVGQTGGAVDAQAGEEWSELLGLWQSLGEAQRCELLKLARSMVGME